jgi:multidrug efflux pump subunit AcrA (membrane-fusion protein)
VRRLLPVIALAGVVVLGGGLFLVGRDDALPRIEVAEVARGEVVEVVEAPGNVAARASATLSAPADAVVEAVLVRDGEPVTRGQVLVRLASDSAHERLRAAESAAANAAASRVEVPRADLSPLQESLDAAAQSSFQAGYDAAALLSDPHQRAAAEQRVEEAEARYWAQARAARDAVGQANAGAGSLETALTPSAGRSGRRRLPP